jgi:chemotaxis protein MotD
MTKLSGTTGQLFAGLAESLTRGVSRATKGAATTGAKTADDSSFHDLLHTVSNMAKRALDDEGSDTTTTKAAAPVRSRLAQLTDSDTSKDAPVDEHTEETKSSNKKQPNDQPAKPDVSAKLSLPTIVGQELAAVPAVTLQTPQQSSGKNDVSVKDDRSSASKREVQSTGAATTATADAARTVATSSVATPSNAARSAIDAFGPRPQPAAAGAQTAAATQQGSDTQSKPMPVTPGFEAVTANVERAAKSAGRDALPETTKVTVVQQETHMPPVAQFSPTQQVANAAVSELKSSPAAAAPAAADLVGTQANAPDQQVKILTVNLEPPSLGNVTMRLRLVGNEVSVQLAAERKETSTMLDQQRDQIRDLVQSTGYVADVAPVQHGSLDGFQTGSGQSQSQLAGQQQQSSQSQGAFSGAGSSSGQSDGGARQARQDQQPNQEARHDQDVAPNTRRGPVYL